jgi:hypothetical protein
VMSSMVGDWWMRRFVEGHVDEEAFNCFRVPSVDSEGKHAKRVTALAGRLAAVDRRFASWAKAVGVEYGPLQDGEKQDMIAELDAVVATSTGSPKSNSCISSKPFMKAGTTSRVSKRS